MWVFQPDELKRIYEVFMSELCAYIDLKISNFMNSIWTQRQWFHNTDPPQSYGYSKAEANLLLLMRHRFRSLQVPSTFLFLGRRLTIPSNSGHFLWSENKVRTPSQFVGSTLRSGFSPVTCWIKDPGLTAGLAESRWVLAMCLPRLDGHGVRLKSFYRFSRIWKCSSLQSSFPKWERRGEKQTLRTKAAPHFICSWAGGGQCEPVSHRRRSLSYGCFTFQ